MITIQLEQDNCRNAGFFHKIRLFYSKNPKSKQNKIMGKGRSFGRSGAKRNDGKGVILRSDLILGRKESKLNIWKRLK